MTPEEFVTKRQAAELKERSAAQSHFDDLCRMLMQQFDQVPERAVEPLHHQHAAGGAGSERAGKPGALRRRAGNPVLEDFGAAGGREYGPLQVEILVVGRNARVPEKHWYFCS